MDFTVGIFLKNLAPQSNFIEFQDCRNFTFFEKTENLADECPCGRAPGLPCGRLHGMQLHEGILAGC